MNGHLDVLKRALADPELEGLDCICPSNSSELRKVADNLSADAHISEWRYGGGQIRYRYHMHVNGVGTRLRSAFEDGARGGNPTLTAVYSKKDIEELIQAYSVHSGC